MPILQCGTAWCELDRWNQPCDRPTYRQAILELAPGVIVHGIAIAVHYDEASFLWNAADPEDQDQLENLWSGLLVEGSPELLIAHGGYQFFVAFQPACGARSARVVTTHRSPRISAATTAQSALLDAVQKLLGLWDSYDEAGPYPLDDAIGALRTALPAAAPVSAPEPAPPATSPA